MQPTQENVISVASGFRKLFRNIALLVAAVAMFVGTIVAVENTRNESFFFLLFLAVPTAVLAIVLLCGHFTLQPNEARVLTLFGEYKGTVVESGFWHTNPFYTKQKISLRTRNFDGEKLKVNDERGNPVEISAVVVWRVSDTAKAVFDVDDYQHFVKVQSESALRHIAKDYPYDRGENDAEDEVTLRGGQEEVSEALKRQIQERLDKAGVEVEEAKLNHIAYAPEIASAMLRRQQAEAIIAARKKIVHGAVTMVEMALDGLAAKNIVELDEERKAAMVSNLLVVLCGETEVHPVINTGTLHN